MNEEMLNLQKQIKENITSLVNAGKIDAAKPLISEYESIIQNDVEIYSIKAVIAIMGNRLQDAENLLKRGLIIDSNNFDLNYNLAYVYSTMQDYNQAFRYYKKAGEKCTDESTKNDIRIEIEKIQKEHKDMLKEDRKKIAFFVKQGMDSFLGDIIIGLSDEYETKKIVVTQYNQIDKGMEWADICWFEWCDELIIYGSKNRLAQSKKIICRLHSYEAFTDYIYQVDWNTVDKLILVSEYIKDNVLKKINISRDKLAVIYNGIELEKFHFKEHKKGYKIAYLGYINFKKGPMLLLHTFKAIYDRDHRYKLYIAGKFQEERYLLYFEQMTKEMGLQDNLFFEGWQDDVDKWLEDKDYILSTSLLESQAMNIMQAMAKGIKPVVHNFVGAKDIYDEKYIWNTINECVDMIVSENYEPKQYRNFVENNYSLDSKLTEIKEHVNKISNHLCNITVSESQKVTIGIPNYNYSKYLDDCLNSILSQDYKNIEVIIVDDHSTDGSIEKIEEYKKTHKNIKAIYHSENSKSCLLAFQEIVKFSKGDKLLFLSADDCLSNYQSIKLLVEEYLNNEKLDYIYGNFNIIDEKGTSIGQWKYSQYSNNEIVYQTFKRGGSGIMPLISGMYNMNYFKRNNINFISDPDNIVAWDTLNTLINIKYDINCKYIDYDFISYRQHGKNMTYNLKQRIPSTLSNMEYIINNFSEEIYMPEQKWNSYDNMKKMSLKYYLIALKYYELYMYYFKGEWKPFGENSIVLLRADLIKYLRPLENAIKRYMKLSLQSGQSYKENVMHLQQELEDAIKTE